MNNHPQQRDDELLLTTIFPSDLPNLTGGFTTRVGDAENDMVPVFVPRAEVEAKLASPGIADDDRERLTLMLALGRSPRSGTAVLDSDSLPEVMRALRLQVSIRDQMGGSTYWNITNDEACRIARHALPLGGAYAEIGEILGEGNFR